MYIKRFISSILREASRQFPAVLVTGPRQAGKTTFLHHEAGANTAYISLDEPIERSFALNDPNGFLDRYREESVVLDEIQYVPELLPYIKIRIDRDRQRPGKWLLTGSQQFHLMKNVSESLAGRVAILDLLPFSLLENRPADPNPLEFLIWNGSYPEPALFPEKRNLWVRSYLQTYIERDVRQLQNIRELRTFEFFLGLAASIHSQVFNAASLARLCGVSLPTIKSWAGVLEASWLCHFLQPYSRNFGKRLVRTPKLYFLDSLLVCALTKQPDAASALAGAMGGALFEGIVVSEAVKVFTMKGKRADLFFWRSHDGLEVDLIVQAGGKLYPVEIKMTATPTLKHLAPLNRFKKLAGKEAADTGILVCRVDQTKPLPFGNVALPWHEFPEWLSERV